MEKAGLIKMDFEKLQDYWVEKGKNSVKMDSEIVKQKIIKYILANNTCALATGIGNYVRNTPIEYSFHDECFWMFSEGGKKFVGLEKNPTVCIAIFDKFTGFANIRGLQIMGEASVVEPFSKEYVSHASWKKISIAVLKKMNVPMNLIKVKPLNADFISSEFKQEAFDFRQQYTWDK